MFLRNLSNQFLHDLKANWQKSALLGVLFVIGLFFWIPPLYRALAGQTPAATASSGTVTAAQKKAAGSPLAVGTRQGPRSLSGSEKPGRLDTERSRRADPLVQSVAPSGIRTDPFHIDPDQFPPPVVFAKEPKVVPRKPTAPIVKTPPHLPEGLVLRSTILGAKHRAAFINRKLYFPGMDVQFDGEVYRLIAVHPQRVVLRHGSVDFDLTIRKRNSPETNGPQRSFVQPSAESTPTRRPKL